MSRIAANTLANFAKTKEVVVEDLIELKAKAFGSLAANPTTRLDGSALVIGDSYYNTVTQANVTFTSTGWNKEITSADVVDVLTSTDATKVLSAAKGKALYDLLLASMRSDEGQITGLIPEWVSATSIKLGTGSAYIPGITTSIKVVTPITLSGLTLTAATWYYLYLYDNAGTPAIELVTTAPAAPYVGTARTKTGDTSRRFVGSFRSLDANTLANFQWINDGTIHYLESVNAAPFRVLVSGTSTTPVTQSLASVIPPTTQTALMIVTAPTASGAYDCYLSIPSVQPKIMRYIGGGAGQPSRSSLTFPTDNTQSITRWVSAMSGASISIDVYGYGSER
jgi:hypothetical protein